MKNAKRLFSLLLCAVLLLSLAAPALAQEENAASTALHSAVVRFEDGADAQTLCDALEALPGIRVRWQYSALFRGAAIEGTKAALALADAWPGVASLSLSRVWTQAAETILDPLDPSNSLAVMHAEDTGYDGDGVLIAVIDSGMNVGHKAFDVYDNIMDPALTYEDVEAFVREGGTEGRYLSSKIPYLYDYCDQDRSVHTTAVHGTHVAALAAGYARRTDGTVEFRGVAPAAQLIMMKVFPDDASRGADDADILKAIEDAYLLGADVINLSLGSTDPFMDAEGVTALYKEIMKKLEADGVVVCCAAGNFGTALTGKTGERELPGCGYTDYASACAPAVYDGTVAVAAVNTLFYEVSGGLVVGDRGIWYSDAVSESEEEILPSADDLAGQELEYVVIGGLGREVDFRGLDLTGCAAVVKRGEIYFSEKVRNAAAAGAVLCIIYNNEPGSILGAVTETTIPCVIITKSEGEYLIEQAQDGRGTLVVAPWPIRVSSGEEMTMLSYSSWGASPDLRLVPTLSAPGGNVLSAINQREYTYMSGTSMASPNAAGAYALMLQALRRQGVEDRTERLRLANALLQSTAQIVSDETNTPLSPRRQGAGVIDLAAALGTQVLIEEPLLELGENESGVFTLRFTVKNLSDEEKVLSVDTMILTDNYVDAGGFLRSALEPLDISELVAVVGPGEIRLAPRSEQAVTLRLVMTAAARNLLLPVYYNGFYTEGYVTLTDESGEAVHATFLGYYGDWEAAPILESVDFRAVINAYYEQEQGVGSALSALPVNMSYNLPLLCGADLDTYGALLPGENPWLVTQVNERRFAISNGNGNGIVGGNSNLVINLYTLRNAEHVIMVVSDQSTGEIYCVDDRDYLPHSPILESADEAMSIARFEWDATDMRGEYLGAGTAVTVSFYAWLESETAISNAYKRHAAEMERGDYSWLIDGSYEAYNEWSFPLVTDPCVPDVSCRVNGQHTAVITVQDEQFVSYVSIQTQQGDYLAEQAFAEEWPGVKHTFTIPLEDLAGDRIYVMAADYAGNTIGYEIAITGNTVQKRQCAVAMLTDVEKDAWYHDAVDFVIEHGLMDLGEGLTFSPEVGALRVQALELVYNMAGNPVVQKDSVSLPFEDVSVGAWYREALCWAYSEGIVQGLSGDLFAAFAPLRRSHLAAMLYRAAAARGEDVSVDEAALSAYTDADAVPDWVQDALAWTMEQGYLPADTEGRINPDDYVTRGEFAYILMMIYQDTLQEQGE